MSEYVSKKELKEFFESIEITVAGRTRAEAIGEVLQAIYNGVMELPTTDAEPIRHGKWITEECLPGVAVCSICGHEIRGIGCQYTKYCDECGARMGEE